MLLSDHVVNRAEILVLRSDAQFDIVTCWDRGKTHFTPPVELLAPKVTRDINIHLVLPGPIRKTSPVAILFRNILYITHTYYMLNLFQSRAYMNTAIVSLHLANEFFHNAQSFSI